MLALCWTDLAATLSPLIPGYTPKVEVAFMRRNYSQAMMAILAVLAAALAVVPSAWAATEQTLYAFKSSEDGDYPNGGLIMVKGRIYGTTMYGGAYGQGTVYELSHTKEGWVKTTLHDFTGLADGEQPWSGVVADNRGNLYGYAGSHPDGLIFELSPDGSGRWQYQVIHVFTGNGEGVGPLGGVIVDDAGNLYGATSQGGENDCYGYPCGIIFELSPSRAGWKFNVLFYFDLHDGQGSDSPLYRDAKGNLYGVGVGGDGLDPCGTAFGLSPSGGEWDFRTLHRFRNDGWLAVWRGGCGPEGPLGMDEAGNVYGTTEGAVYRLKPAGKKWALAVLHTFGGQGDGSNAAGGVVLDSKGNLFGATFTGGQYGWGTVFEVSPSGKGWKESVLFSFNGYDGNHPQYGLSWGKPGELIGATETGGSPGYGVVYAVRP